LIVVLVNTLSITAVGGSGRRIIRHFFFCFLCCFTILQIWFFVVAPLVLFAWGIPLQIYSITEGLGLIYRATATIRHGTKVLYVEGSLTEVEKGHSR